MALVDTDKDPWLTEYDSCEKLHRDIVDLLNKRSVELSRSDNYAHLSTVLRQRLKQYDNEVQQLSGKLRSLALSRTITLDEAERRERLVENLKTNGFQLHCWFSDRDVVSSTQRSELLNERPHAASEPLLPAYRTSTPNSSAVIPEYTVSQLREQRQRLLEDQNAGLEELAKTVSRQKQIAVRIEQEVDLHNDILDDISDRMERTAGGIQRESDQINVLLRKDSTGCYMFIIIVLLIAIIVVLLL